MSQSSAPPQETSGCIQILPITFGVWMWDLLISVHSEIPMWRRHAFTWVDFVYVLSRITTAGHIVASFVFLNINQHHFNRCRVVLQFSAWMGAISMPLNSLLFLARIIGIFHDNKTIKLAFSVLWMSTLAPIVVPFMVSAQRDDTAKKCGSVHKLASTVLMTCVVAAIYDTCVFIAISLEVLMAYPAEGWKARIKVFLNKNEMGHLFRAVLQTGQLYYLATAAANIVTVILLWAPGVPAGCRMLAPNANRILQTIMACKVLRLLRSGALKHGNDVFRSTVPSNPSQIPNLVFDSQRSTVSPRSTTTPTGDWTA